MHWHCKMSTFFIKLQSLSKVLGRLPFLPLLFLPPPAPGPMFIKTFELVIVLLYPNNVDQNVNICVRNCSVISQHRIGGRGDI